MPWSMGRGLYDNLKKYIRFQMAGLFGFIATFLGSSIFCIAGGVPFLPLQTLWVNFTVQVFQAIGLGYGKPADGLMQRKPRPAEQPILPRHAARLAGVHRACSWASSRWASSGGAPTSTAMPWAARWA